jgi:hypothetical protein
VKVPAELVKEWMAEFYGTPTFIGEVTTGLANKAAQWGADQELEACCEYLQSEIGPLEAAHFRAARRPKPPTLAEQGLKLLEPPNGPVMLGTPEYRLTEFQSQILRAALNRLAELEANQ